MNSRLKKMTESRFGMIRSSDERYWPKPEELSTFLDEFNSELDGFGELSSLEKERNKLLAEVEKLNKELEEKDNRNEELQNILIETHQRVRYLEKQLEKKP